MSGSEDSCAAAVDTEQSKDVPAETNATRSEQPKRKRKASQGRKPGKQAREDLSKVVEACIVLPRGQTMPAISKQCKQYVFKARHCKLGVQHFRVLNPHSIRHPTVLTCRVCNNNERCLKIATEEAKDKPFKKLSAAEQRLIQDVHEHQVGGARRQFVHEIKPFLACGPLLCKVSVDIVIYDGCISADAAEIKRGLLVFFDSKLHRPWKEENQRQAATDKQASREAAKQKFCVLRISHRDVHRKMEVLDQAWAARDATGWVKVSPMWNKESEEQDATSGGNLLHAPYWEKITQLETA